MADPAPAASLSARLTLRLLFGIVGVGIAACAHPSETSSVTARYPTATYESRVMGCAQVGAHSRRFGRDPRTAILVAREEVRNARYFPCEATIVALVDGVEHPVRRLSLARDGRYEERELPP